MALIFITSGSTFTAPGDWPGYADKVETIGGGATGANASGLGGAGGGAYARLDSGGGLTFGNGAALQVGGAGQDTWISNTGSAPTTTSQGCLAKGGSANSGATGGLGGDASSCVGTTKYSGGNGGNSNTGGRCGGGGGDAGPSGAGANGGNGFNSSAGTGGGGGANGGSAGGNATSLTVAGNGGNGPGGTGGGAYGATNGTNGTAGTGGGGGGNTAGSNGNGGAGGSGSEWDSTHGAGGGGGGEQGAGTANAVGGLYGGGAGSRRSAAGAQGIIVITYTPATGDYPVTVTESASAADTVSAGSALGGTVSESGSAAEAASQVFAVTKAIAESGSAVDTVGTSSTLPGTTAESVTASDAVGAVLGIAKSVAESGTAVDASGKVTAQYAWIGAVTDGGMTCSWEISASAAVRLAVSTSSGMTSPSYGGSSTATKGKSAVTGLSANTTYYWGLEIGGSLSTVPLGSIKTFPTAAAAAHFKIAFGSCSTNADALTYDAIAAETPLFMLNTGDMFYGDISANTPALYQAAFRAALVQTKRQMAMLRNVPIAYTWDDHDYGVDNSNGSATSRPAALTTYREWVPHYPIPLAGADDDTPIYQTFVCGRVRFFLLDGRSSNVPGSTRLGTAQRAQFFADLAAATEALMVIVVEVPWIASSSSDTWWGYSAERTAIADQLVSLGLNSRTILVAGDMHSSAYDDGTNSGYQTGGGVGPPVFQVAPIYQAANSVKGGGTYSGGSPIQDSLLQYGTLDFDDDGTDIDCAFKSYSWNGSSWVQRLSYSFTINGVTNFPVTRAESASAADTSSSAAAFAKAVAEAEAAADTLVANGNYSRLLAEAIAVAEAQGAVTSRSGTAAELASASDTQFVLQAWLAGLQEASAAAEASSAILGETGADVFTADSGVRIGKSRSAVLGARIG